MPKGVFVVVDGEYSDYHIVGIFSTRQLAKDHVKMYGGYAEVWRLDDDTIYNGRKGLAEFNVWMDRVGQVYGSPSGSIPSENTKYPYISFYQDQLWLRTLAKDTEHAVKIANEVRAQILAANVWGIDVK
jgi:hypothetical protein